MHRLKRIYNWLFVCKKKYHHFEYTHIESDGWGNEWHWKKCKRCGYSTFDIKKSGEENE